METRYQTAEPQSSPYMSNTKEDMRSDIPKVKETVPSISPFSTYGLSEDNRHFDTQVIRKPQRNSLKTLIPVVAAVIGVVIVVVVIFGSGVMHQQPQTYTPAPTHINPPTIPKTSQPSTIPKTSQPSTIPKTSTGEDAKCLLYILNGLFITHANSEEHGYY